MKGENQNSEDLNKELDGIVIFRPVNPVFIPPRHTVESYRAQQRKAKARRRRKPQKRSNA